MGLLSTGESCPMFQSRSRVVDHDGCHLYFGQTTWRWTGCNSCGTFLMQETLCFLIQYEETVLHLLAFRACVAINESSPGVVSNLSRSQFRVPSDLL